MAYTWNPGFENDGTLIGQGWYDEWGNKYSGTGTPEGVPVDYTSLASGTPLPQDLQQQALLSAREKVGEIIRQAGGNTELAIQGILQVFPNQRQAFALMDEFVQYGMLDGSYQLPGGQTLKVAAQEATDSGSSWERFSQNFLPYAGAFILGGMGLNALGAQGLAGVGAAEGVGAYGGMDAGAVAGADYGAGAAGLGGAGAGGVEVGAWPGSPQPVNEGPFMVNPSPGGPVQTLPDMPLGGNVTAGPGAVDLTAGGAGAGTAPGFVPNFDEGPYGGFDPTADYTGATQPPIISNFGGPQDNFGLAPPFMSGGQGGIPGMGGGSPLNSILNGTDWLGLGSDILGYAGQREYQKDLMSALNRAIDYSDPAYAQRGRYQQQYANMQEDPNWMNQGFLGNIRNEALRGTAAQNASQGYMGSGNILHDLTRTGAETTAKYALPYMEQIGQAGGLLGGRQNASGAISSLGQAAGQAGLGQNYAIGSALGRLPRQGVNSTINSGINSVLSGLGML